MVSVLFGLVFAYMQIMYVLVDGVVLGIGLLIVGYAAYQRLHERGCQRARFSRLHQAVDEATFDAA